MSIKLSGSLKIITPVIIQTIIVPENLVRKSPIKFKIFNDCKIPPNSRPKPANNSLIITINHTLKGNS